MKKLLLILTLITGCLWTYSTFASNLSINCSGMNCFIAGVKDAGNAIGVTGVVTGEGITQAVQDFIVYLLSFLSLVAVIYIMYAGAQLLFNPADEESAAKTKKIIVGVISGIVIIWFAYWIVSTIFFLVNGGSKKAFIPRAVAETQIRNVDFITYTNQIEALKTKLDIGYSPEVMNELSMLVDGAYDHLPDRADLYGNKQLYDEVKQDIKDYNLYQTIIYRGVLQTAIKRFTGIIEDTTQNAKVYVITSQPDVNPPQGSAPLSVTLEAKQTIDESGTVIPNENYIWWLRTSGNTSKILGKGKIINYTFDTEGTYSVFLTVNSASKNSRGFTDTISFEKNVVVEVKQAEVHFAVKINDQLADGVMKLSTKEALKPIRIDASETRFASGYTTKTTDWDFGNGNTRTNEGDPQFESQSYTPGDHTIRLKLIRNDGQEFSYNVMLKIGDPLASIFTNTRIPNKGEKAIFQAKKTSTEEDVQYLWEVRKQGSDTVLYSSPGTRLEYTFLDTGKFFITLTSIKGDARDKDTMEINIESRPPNVQFTSDMVSSELPNVYAFDGSNSFDPDYPDNQKLRFEWFVNDTPIQLTETNERNSRGKYTFPEKGTYRVVLRVSDEEGKTKEYKRDIKITTILSVQLTMRPEVVKRGAKVLLTVIAPRATTYEWKIGNSDPIRTESNRFVTSFPTSGTFPIAVTVTNADGDTNTAVSKIFITEDEKPFSVIDIKSDSLLTSSQKSLCSGQEATTVDRANAVSFSSERSINTDGRNNDLTYFWKIGLNKTSTQKNVSYTFDELGCEEISLIVTDKITGASHTSTTWVKVINLAPVFNDIDVAVENIDMDPMRVNLKILGAKDPDGVIRSYTWYYYTDKDDQAQGFRITRVPEATFVLPKITGRYYFAVMMEDSNGLKINTKEVSDVLFSTPDLYVNTNLATPIIENFKADNSEVKFGDVTHLSLEVRTPVSSDVSAQSEYRWDIDGDGFYDVKTTTPFYDFKYVYPGEYNPKVKVTHKGMSATKSITIEVKNSLIPKATIQMLGNKIVAYNTSTGVFQSANWYLDDKKISENKDYLISEIVGSNVQNLKLEISDGKATESVVYPLQASLKNKVLLKKITRSLVILSPMSGNDIQETPDDIVWEDPLSPLFLYLGESRGDIRYYIIDTDIDIDTDLSGGKDDDADNKGTASYRSGRPFQIPKGTKRVTIMKIRIVGNNNQDIDSRQIRVTRKFLTATEPEIVTDTQAPQTFNLTQADKDRIDKLRNLVQSAPTDEKKELNRILDQLGDNWYDVTERIQTLNLFSNTVDASKTLSADLKKKILEQISIVYTQGDDQIEEHQLALKMITEYLAKSPKKIQIFGDTNTPGLINDIINSPEYYEANLKVIQKIMDDYVDPDTTLSAEVKKDIKDKLLILAGSPPATPTNPATPKNTTSNTLQWFLWILGGIMCIIFGGIGIVYARGKITSHEGVSALPPTTVDTISQPTVLPEGTPDWLKEENSSPFGNEDVFSNEITSSSSEIHQPDWLQDTTAASVSIPTSEEGHSDTITTPDISTDNANLPQEKKLTTNANDIPDWLQGDSSLEEKASSDFAPKSLTSEEVSVDTVTSIPLVSKVVDSPESHDDVIPETVAGSDDASIQSSAQNNDDIPDWLRGAESTVIELEIPPVSENKTAFEGKSTDTPISFSDQIEENDGKNLKTEIGIASTEGPLLESPENLLFPAHDTLIAPPEKKSTKKKKTTPKKNVVSSNHLLESEHDMLLPQSTDNPL